MVQKHHWQTTFRKIKINLFLKRGYFYTASIRKTLMINLLAHKGEQLSHLESQQIEILSHELSCNVPTVNYSLVFVWSRYRSDCSVYESKAIR